MGKHAQIVVGPAGVGKSTYCGAMQLHCDKRPGRSMHIVNLDPAAEYLCYSPLLDIRELVSLADVSESMGFGPNGGLVYCMEYLSENLDWLEEALGNHEDDFLVVDSPGQIELFTHMSVMKSVVLCLQRLGYSVGCVFLMDSSFISDPTRFLAGSLTALASMVRLELPHLNVVTKMDIVMNQRELELGRSFRQGGSSSNPEVEERDPEDVFDEFLEQDSEFVETFLSVNIDELLRISSEKTGPSHLSLAKAIGNLLDDFSMVEFFPLNIYSERSLDALLYKVDQALQYGEDVEPIDRTRHADEHEQDFALRNEDDGGLGDF